MITSGPLLQALLAGEAYLQARLFPAKARIDGPGLYGSPVG
jgi:hypothetical protein